VNLSLKGDPIFSDVQETKKPRPVRPHMLRVIIHAEAQVHPERLSADASEPCTHAEDNIRIPGE
jgi:hypothetical protein